MWHLKNSLKYIESSKTRWELTAIWRRWYSSLSIILGWRNRQQLLVYENILPVTYVWERAEFLLNDFQVFWLSLRKPLNGKLQYHHAPLIFHWLPIETDLIFPSSITENPLDCQVLETHLGVSSTWHTTWR